MQRKKNLIFYFFTISYLTREMGQFVFVYIEICDIRQFSYCSRQLLKELENQLGC